jgi:hypothetical protein
MTGANGADPLRATFIAILQQLNRAESLHEGNSREQLLELGELEHNLKRFWAIDERGVKVPQALGLLVRNGLVQAKLAPPPPSAPPTRNAARYGITSQGKQFLIESVHQADRIA